MIPVRNAIGGMGNLMFKEAYLYAQVRDGIIPDVYVQDEVYFEKYKDEIKLLFGQGIGYIDQVSIHVRRGDYINNPFYVDLFKTGYYERAMAEFPDADFLVFSDNIEWCKRQDIFKDCEFSEGLDEVADLNLMASCNGHIMANSSYSWWGSYLGYGKTVAPKDWYSEKNFINLASAPGFDSVLHIDFLAKWLHVNKGVQFIVDKKISEELEHATVNQIFLDNIYFPSPSIEFYFEDPTKGTVLLNYISQWTWVFCKRECIYLQ